MKTACEFHFGFWDVTARGDAHFSVSQNQSFAKIEDINAEGGITFPDVITLEPSFGWPLDGSKEWMPKNANAYTWGWWSTEQSGRNKLFVNAPTLTVSFYDDAGTPTPHSSAGITFTFVASIPETVNIKWYNLENAILMERDFSPNRLEYFCDCQVEDYYKVVITIKSMKYAHRFFRASSILFGALEILDGSRVTKAILAEEISPVSLTLPIDKLDVAFHTPDGRFALLDPTGAYKLFQWGQELTGYKTIDGQKTALGKFYLQEATGTVDAITELSCASILGVLDALEYEGGIYSEMPLPALLEDILEPSGVEFEIAPDFVNVTISGHLPICSKRKALQQIAFAIGAIISPSSNGDLHIFPAPAVTVRTITPARKIIGHKVKMEPLVTQVDVTAHRYTQSDELKELTKTTLEPGEHTINFSNPVSVQSITGGTLITSHPNYCVVQVASSGEIIVSGYEYIDTKTVYTVRTDTLPAGTKPATKSVSTATLLDPDKAKAAAQRLYDYYQLRYTDEGRLLPGGEQVSDKVSLSSLGGRPIVGYVQRVVTDLAAGCLESVVVRGK